MADYKLQFTAVIEKQGPNPYVDVPDLPAAVVARFGKGGRVRVRGTLNGAPVQASLVPVGKQGRRLYVNGGMRAAAKVDVGDTAAFDLEPMPYDEVVVAGDVAAGLLEAGADTLFNALPPSHRREWIGFIDDARTPETRAKRIRQTAAELLGVPATPARPERNRPLWTCPECGNEFVNPNQYHSCAKRSVETPFQGKPAHVQASFDRLRAMVEQCGPVKLVPMPTVSASWCACGSPPPSPRPAGWTSASGCAIASRAPVSGACKRSARTSTCTCSG